MARTAGKTVAEQQAEALGYFRVFSTELEALVAGVNDLSLREMEALEALETLAAQERRGEAVMSWDDVKPAVLAWAESMADLMERVRPALALALQVSQGVESNLAGIEAIIEERANALLVERAIARQGAASDGLPLQ